MGDREFPKGLADGRPTGASIRRRPASLLGWRAPPDPPEAYRGDLRPQGGEVSASPKYPSSKDQAGR